MKLSPTQVCKSKVKYHTLKSAERAQIALAVGYKTQFDIYKCGDSKHYHLTHKNPAERIGHGNQAQTNPEAKENE